MNKYLVLVILLSGFLLQACKTNLDAETYSKYQTLGNDISNQAQATLLANVGKAIQSGGPEFAVEFCNLEASDIIDSLNRLHHATIARVSANNRNPENALQSDTDKELWQVFENHALGDTVIQDANHIFYYKRINTAMPACLKCHGEPGSDINAATIEKLDRLYPADLATGYHLNDFRGMWKIEFVMEKE